MAKRIDYESFVNKEYKNFKIIRYEKLDKNHMFLIKFHQTGNEDWVRYARLKKHETIKDKKLLKEKAKLREIEHIKNRNRITKKKKATENATIYGNECVLVLDASTSSTGYCVVNHMNVVRHGTIIPNSKYHLTMKMHYINEEIKKIIQTYNVTKIIMEDIYLGLNSNILIILAELRGVIKSNWLPIQTVRATDWKRYHNVERRNDRGKSSSMDIALSKGYRISTDDESDAILIALYCLR